MLITPNGEIQERAVEIGGRASIEATAGVPARYPDWSHSYKMLGRTGLTVSAAGFGSYRVHRSVQEHRAALAKAVRMGINIVDTSSNYSSGNSERLIGEVLSGLVVQGQVKREEMIVVSKGGYIQGERFEEMQRRANAAHADYSAGSELSELVRHSQGLWHSIHPDFLRDQISESLERLQLETIDVYLLHNPEYYIEWALNEGVPAEDVRDEYHRRIRRAFEHLESEVERGRIAWYGISSNTFPKPEESVDRTSLEAAWRAAEELAGAGHHFGVIEFPMNLFEAGAIANRNQRHGTKTLLEFCGEQEIGVLVNRPLNAIVRSTGDGPQQLIRLADFPEREIPPEPDIDDLLHDIRLQEEEFVSGPLKSLELDAQGREAVEKFLTLGRNLDQGNWKEFASVEEWQDISRQVLAPRIQYAFDVLRPATQEVPLVLAFLTNYAESVDEAFEHLSNYYTNRGHARSMKIHQALDAVLGEEYRELSLSQKAIVLLRSIPEVSSVLVGMRTEEYVEDVIYGLQAKPVSTIEQIWERLAAGQREP